MPLYTYQARDVEGKPITGTIEASDPVSASVEIRRKNLIVISIEEKKKPLLSLFFVIKVKPKEVAVFTRQLATMTSAGVTLVEALETLAEQAEDRKFQRVLEGVITRIRAGGSFSAAISEYPGVFSSTYVHMIKAAEASGQLDQVLERLATYLEASEELKREIKSAMIYPCVSLFIVLGIATGLLIFIIPQFKDLFSQLGLEKLPGPTLLLLGLSGFVQTNFLWIIISLFVLFIVFRFLTTRVETGRYIWHTVANNLPIFGGLIRKIALARFANTFASLQKAGVNMLHIVEIVARTTGNAVIEKALLSSKESISRGESLASTFSQHRIFPPLIIKTMQVGEQSGELDKLLEKVSGFYEHEVRTAIKGLTSMIEPVLIMLLGGIVGFMILAIFMPILELQAKLAK